MSELGPNDPDNSRDPKEAFQEPTTESNFVEPWFGVDLDGTLAMYHGFKGPAYIGEPVPKMVALVKTWLATGTKVKIFTARISVASQKEQAEDAIKAWCIKHIGQELEITNEKDIGMVILYDDRCKQVETNTGRFFNV